LFKPTKRGLSLRYKVLSFIKGRGTLLGIISGDIWISGVNGCKVGVVDGNVGDGVTVAVSAGIIAATGVQDTKTKPRKIITKILISYFIKCPTVCVTCAGAVDGEAVQPEK
jgi:hypothetical protein